MPSPNKRQGLPLYYGAGTAGTWSPPKQGYGAVGNFGLSIQRSRSGFFAVPSNKRKTPGSAAKVLRMVTAISLALLLFMLAYMQLNLTGSADAASDRMDRSTPRSSKADANTADAGAAAANADAANQAAAAAAVPPAEPPAGGYPAPTLQHLVLVAGHAVYTGVDYALAAKETSWFLEPYQQIPGQAQTFLDHIKLGIEAAAADPSALLLFSGGQTRQAAGPRSEGLSYWMVAEAAGWYGHQDVRSRAFTEEHARDSFENVLFSLCRFFELTGHYPAKITAVSYTLKQQRFEQLHRAAVRFPAAAFHFIGTPVPEGATGAAAGEAATVAAFQRGPYGCSGSLLQKKARRDPFAVGPPHPSRCPAMAGLLKLCSHKQYTGEVPWETSGKPAAAAAAAGAGGGSSEGGGGGSSKGGLLPAGRRSSRSGMYT